MGVSLQTRQLKMCKEGWRTKLTEERVRLLEVVGLEYGIGLVLLGWIDL